MRWDGQGIYLVQAPPGISQEGDGMTCPHADGHSSEAGRRAIQYGLCFYWHPAGHRAGGVVRTTRVGLQSVLETEEWSEEEEDSETLFKQ